MLVYQTADVVRIHIRLYKCDSSGQLLPTKRGISLTPAQWQSFVNEMDSVRLSSDSKRITIGKDSVLIGIERIDDQPHISLQCFFQTKDFSRRFVPSICLLRESEWNELKRVRKEITSSAVRVMFDHLFRKILLQETRKRMPSNIISESNSDIESALTTSMAELLKDYLSSNIAEIFQCSGCEMELGNQLGHECIMSGNDYRADVYGDRALLNIDLHSFVNDFIERNIQISNYLSECFISSLDTSCLIKTAIDLYVASDPEPMRVMF